MNAGEISPEQVLYAAILTLPRIFVAMTVLPFLSPAIISGTVRGLLAFALVILVIPLTYMHLERMTLQPALLLFLLPKEILIGLILGFLAAIPFWVAAGLGRLMDMQRGSFMATMFSPAFQDAASPLGTLFTQAVTVVFFTTAGVHLFLGALYESYLVWPVHHVAPGFAEGGANLVADLFQSIFYWIAVLGAPLIILVLLIDLLMGILNRFIPEVNVFFLAFPFKAALVMFVLVIYADILMGGFAREWLNNEGWFRPLQQILVH